MSDLHLSKPTLAFAKLVATPTDNSWSQVYNAGNIFACVSLLVEEETDEIVSLSLIGKNILDTLQAEFFTLEEKTLTSISDVVLKSIEDVPQGLSPDITVGFFKESLLYLFIVGKGRVIMKRQGKIGILLQSTHDDTKVHTASGYLNNDDMIILETRQFAEDITDETLASALELGLPNDIAEVLSPQLHARDNGGQAAIIIVYHGISKGIKPHELVAKSNEEEEKQEQEEELVGGIEEPEEEAFEEHERHTLHEEQESPDEEPVIQHEQHVSQNDEEVTRKQKPVHALQDKFGAFIKKFHITLPQKSDMKLNHTRKLFLSITIILVIILGVSIFYTKQKETTDKLHTEFVQIYNPAERTYEDGKALETLNKDRSYQDYLQAKQSLTDNMSKFPKGSSEAQQMQGLLAKVNDALSQTDQTQNAVAKEITVDDTSLLGVEKANKDGLGFTEDDSAVYFVTNTAIDSVAKNGGAKKELIKNDSDWQDPVGLATYEGNFYILDRKKGIVKFVSTSDGYTKSNYFKQTPNLSSATDLAIDSSIWILLSDGSVLKYTAGTADSFKTPVLEKQMQSPKKIFTTADSSNFYILDQGNGRIIKFPKDGTGNTEYAASVLKNAQDFTVDEKAKTIDILSDTKTYEIAL